MVLNLIDPQALQIELQAPRKNRDGQPLGIGGGQQKFDVWRRFLERFEQRVEGMIGKHMDFVDQVDLEPPTCRRVLHVVEQFTGFIHLRARRGIHLDQIHVTALVDFETGTALSARGAADACFAIQGFGQHARDRGFADPAGAGKQIGMVKSLAVQRIYQRAQHMALANHLAEIARAPFARQNLIGHWTVRHMNGWSGGPASHTSAPAVTVTAAPFRA